MTNRINFKNISALLDAVDETNDVGFFQKNFLCYFLRTGDTKCFSKEARKIIKKVNFEELLIDVQATLMLHDSIKCLIKGDMYKMYSSNYWELLYSNMPSTIDNYDGFVEQYKNNFNELVSSECPAFNMIIYTCLEDTLLYVRKVFNSNINDKELIWEYISAMRIPNVILSEKEKLSENKKGLFKKLQKTKEGHNYLI